jgi:protein TonB
MIFGGKCWHFIRFAVGFMCLALLFSVPRAAESNLDLSLQQKAALREYQMSLARAMERYKRYPAEALKKGYAGTAMVSLQMNSEGKVVNATVTNSSGFASLDDAARLAAIKAKALVHVPEPLRGYAFEAKVRVVYELSPAEAARPKPLPDFRHTP